MNNTDDAYKAGALAYREGKQQYIDNPYAVASHEYDHWHNGWWDEEEKDWNLIDRSK